MSRSEHLGLYKAFLRGLERIENARVRSKMQYNVRSAFELQRHSSSTSKSLLQSGRNDLALLQAVAALDGPAQSRLLADWRHSSGSQAHEHTSTSSD